MFTLYVPDSRFSFSKFSTFPLVVVAAIAHTSFHHFGTVMCMRVSCTGTDDGQTVARHIDSTVLLVVILFYFVLFCCLIRNQSMNGVNLQNERINER